MPGEASEYLDEYLMPRVHKPGISIIQNLPYNDYIFTNPKGGKISDGSIRMIMERISKQASAQLPEKDKFHATSHMLRHLFLKRVGDKHGVHVAQEMKGNVSIKEVWRYTRPSDQEKSEISEGVFN